MDTASTTATTTKENAAADFVGQLLDWANRHPDLRCHLLIDSALRDARETWETMPADLDERRTPIAVHESLFPPDQRPCFYGLDLAQPADRAVLENSVALMLEDWSQEAAPLGQGHRICAWLWAPQEISANDLAQHLGRQAVQYDLSRNGRVLLRYFDPRVLDLLWQGLNAEQQATLLGPIHAWQFIDRTSALRILSAHRKGDAASSQRLALTERQWAMLSRAGWMNQALTRLQASSGLPPHRTAVQQADDALLRAQLHRLHQEHDLIEFAYLALTRHPRFDEHPLMRPILDAVREGEDFIDAMQRLTPDQWQQIGAGYRMTL